LFDQFKVVDGIYKRTVYGREDPNTFTCEEDVRAHCLAEVTRRAIKKSEKAVIAKITGLHGVSRTCTDGIPQATVDLMKPMIAQVVKEALTDGLLAALQQRPQRHRRSLGSSEVPPDQPDGNDGDRIESDHEDSTTTLATEMGRFAHLNQDNRKRLSLAYHRATVHLESPMPAELVAACDGIDDTVIRGILINKKGCDDRKKITSGPEWAASFMSSLKGRLAVIDAAKQKRMAKADEMMKKAEAYKAGGTPKKARKSTPESRVASAFEALPASG
jgi:hypothetical protein